MHFLLLYWVLLWWVPRRYKIIPTGENTSPAYCDVSYWGEKALYEMPHRAAL